MVQEEVTIVRLRKSTRNRLKELAIASRESYDEIISRLLGGKTDNSEEELKRRKQKLLQMGVSKKLVDLLGVAKGKINLEDEKEITRRTIRRRMMMQ